MTTTTVREKPILFSGPMVKAILDGRKTMTRRVVKPQPEYDERGGFVYTDGKGDRWLCGLGVSDSQTRRNFVNSRACPYGKRGDRLWVRETWNQVHAIGGGQWHTVSEPREKSKAKLVYLATCADGHHPPKWRPSIHMPRWASRLTLEITDIRVERLNEISDDDAVRELGAWRVAGEDEKGLFDTTVTTGDPHGDFRDLWESINGHGSWDANPWVWVISFEVQPCPTN